ncbi:universal stress protein [Arthrobacter sp. B3I4]|uniref:universal stress protein n=1 Tax=Arthrobacter sp. B3I4 TaxID=3042267 RepID=UPI002788114F|nr:universal stress protein [Arthrobacter sp. B3I4]MDQ0756226.1 nucleotide-binding universal stress UspA family protein [Arthrobacter sp. B3I4]
MADNGSFRILVGADGSPQSQAALDWAVEEAKLRRGTVLALAAWNFPYVSDALGQAWDYGVFQSDAETILEAELNRVGNLGVVVTGRTVQSNPASALVEASREADLVAVGSRGHGGFTGMLLGSVSAQLVHHAHCPVLVFREPSPE